ncbi:MAG: TonB-dependent receptor, partial [Bacteroidota bacterium]
MQYLLFFGLCFQSYSLFAQITGNILDEASNPVAYANILLLQSSDSLLAKGTLTDENGNFSIDGIEKGQYILNVSFIGYQDWSSEIFDFEGSKNFNGIRLTTNAVALEGVEVKAQKMLVQQSKEGTVVNVQSSLLTRGSSALQVLERSPGIFIDRRDGNISLNGQTGVRLMINGKIIRLSINESIAMLNGMSADNIEKIELLTNPSAKYEADGAGLINIVLKKDQSQGTNGSISLSVGYGWKEKASASLNLNHRRSDVNVYGSYTFSHDHSFLTWIGGGTENIPVLGGDLEVDFFFENDPKIQNHNFTLGVDKEWNDKTDVGASINLIRASDRSNILNAVSYIMPPDSFINMQIRINNHSQWNNWLSSAYLEHHLDSKGKFNITADYLSFKNQNPTIANSQYFNRNQELLQPESELFADQVLSESETDIAIGVLKIDFEQQLNDALKIQTGLKGTYSGTSNSGSAIRNFQEAWEADDRYANKNSMIEKIGAAYASFDWQMNPSLNLTLGARYEYWNRQFSPSTTDNRKRGKLFPSVFLTKQISDISNLNCSYTQRITRPDFNDLASFARYNGPISVFSGNPLLRPMITDNLRLAYQYKSYNFSLHYNHSDNPIARYQLATNEAGNLISVSPQNVVYEQRIGGQINVNQEVTPWWTMNISVTAEQRKFELSHTPESVAESYFAANFNGSQRFQLPKDFSFELSGWYLTPFYDGSRRHDGFGHHQSTVVINVLGMMKLLKYVDLLIAPV